MATFFCTRDSRRFYPSSPKSHKRESESSNSIFTSCSRQDSQSGYRDALDFLMVLRVIRIFKIFHSIPRFRIVINTILHILPSFATYGCLLLLVTFSSFSRYVIISKLWLKHSCIPWNIVWCPSVSANLMLCKARSWSQPFLPKTYILIFSKTYSDYHWPEIQLSILFHFCQLGDH